MSSQIHCPACTAAFAYSPALLGKTVRCRDCRHEFPVTEAPSSTVKVSASVPPPLPSRGEARRPEPPPTRSERDWPRRRDMDDDSPRRRPMREEPERSGTGTMIGLIAAGVLAFLVVASGLAWYLWPKANTSPASNQQSAEVPITPLVVDTPGPNLDEILRQAPRNEGPKGVQPRRPEPPRRDPPEVGPPGVTPRLKPPKVAPPANDDRDTTRSGLTR